MYLQVYWRVCISVCPVLLLQEVKHVWSAADIGVPGLHSFDLLRVFPYVSHSLVLCVAQVCSVHICQHQDGLDSRVICSCLIRISWYLKIVHSTLEAFDYIIIFVCNAGGDMRYIIIFVCNPGGDV